jgi:glycosyltransferase involved in cell wall biosynthesis
VGKKKQDGKKDAPVRVLHLIDRISGYGTTRSLWDIVRLTATKDVKHFVITFSPDQGKQITAERLREMGAYRLFPKTGLLKWGRRNWVWYLVRYILVLWRVLQSLFWYRPHIIHVHTSRVLTVGWFVKAVLRRPVVHLVPQLFSQMENAGKTWVPKFYARFHSRIDCFFALSPRSRDELLSIEIPGSKIIPFYGQLDFQEINEARERQQQYEKTIRETLYLSSDSLIVLSIGRLHSSKGHNFALDALPALLQEFPQLHWLVVGDGPEGAELEARAKMLGISSHVHLLGHQEHVLPYYAAAAIFLRTMIFEATNLVTFQAMAMGLPVVGFDVGSATELLKKVGNGILVPNKNVEALSTAVAQLLRFPDHGREMGRLGMEYSQENFDIQKSIEDMTTVYNNLKDGVYLRKDIRER